MANVFFFWYITRCSLLREFRSHTGRGGKSVAELPSFTVQTRHDSRKVGGSGDDAGGVCTLLSVWQGRNDGVGFGG